jgi:Tfp pilus assembly protein FimT
MVPPGRGDAGATFVDLLATVALVAIVAAMSVPMATTGADRARGRAAARYLAARVAVAKLLAVSRSATVALRFEEDDGAIRFSVVIDGNGNGVRTADIDAGLDRVLEPPMTLAAHYPGVVIGLAPGTPASAPVQIGVTNLWSFTPVGTATPGSVYVRGRDGTQWVVRVFGGTARARVLRWEPARGQWVDSS